MATPARHPAPAGTPNPTALEAIAGLNQAVAGLTRAGYALTFLDRLGAAGGAAELCDLVEELRSEVAAEEIAHMQIHAARKEPQP